MQGTAPLYVKFAAAGYDPDGDIQEYYWDFGDNSDNQPERIYTDIPEAVHIYNAPGTYKAKVQVKDTRGNWLGGNVECELEIKAKEKPEPQVLGASDDKVLPETGASAIAFPAGIVISALSLVVAKNKFKLV